MRQSRAVTISIAILLCGALRSADERFAFRVVPQRAGLGETVHIDVVMDNAVPVAGYEISLSFDSDAIEVVGVSPQRTVVEDLRANFFHANVGDAWLTVGSIPGLSDTPQHVEIPPGEGQLLATVTVRPKRQELRATTVTLENGLGVPFPVINHALFREGTRIVKAAPHLSPGTITWMEAGLRGSVAEKVRPGGQTEIELRGDVIFDPHDGESSITGYTITLAYAPDEITVEGWDLSDTAAEGGSATWDVNAVDGLATVRVTDLAIPGGRDLLLGRCSVHLAEGVGTSTVDVLLGEESYLATTGSGAYDRIRPTRAPIAIPVRPALGMKISMGSHEVIITEDDRVRSVTAPCGAELTFANASSGPFESLQWDFGDGLLDSETEPVVHNYECPGDCPVILSLFDGNGDCCGSLVAEMRVYAAVTCHTGPENPRDDSPRRLRRPGDTRVVLCQFLLNTPCTVELGVFTIAARDFLTAADPPPGVPLVPAEWIDRLHLYEDTGTYLGVLDDGDRFVGEGSFRGRLAHIHCTSPEAFGGSRKYLVTCDFREADTLPGQSAAAPELPSPVMRSPASFNKIGGTPAVWCLLVALLAAIVIRLTVTKGVNSRRTGLRAAGWAVLVLVLASWFGCVDRSSSGGTKTPGTNPKQQAIVQVQPFDVHDQCSDCNNVVLIKNGPCWGPVIRFDQPKVDG